jgi:catechol 2,3-dioxygenase-like lactoylglutathione lyase family enzyme
MSITLDHTIVPARDKHRSAGFLAGLFGLAVDEPLGPFVPVRVGGALTLDYADAAPGQPIPSHHYAFRVGDEDFDAIFGRIRAAGLRYYAHPHEPHGYGEVNTSRGGRTVYFDDPDGHVLEILTAG